MVPKTTGHLRLSCQHNLHLWWCVKCIEVLWKLFLPPDCVKILSPLVCKNVCPSRHLPTVYENCLYLPPVMCKIVCHPLCVKMFVGPPPYVCEKYLFLMVKKTLLFPKFLVFKLVKISQEKFCQEKWYRDICLKENFVFLTNV